MCAPGSGASAACRERSDPGRGARGGGGPRAGVKSPGPGAARLQSGAETGRPAGPGPRRPIARGTGGGGGHRKGEWGGGQTGDTAAAAQPELLSRHKPLQ